MKKAVAVLGIASVLVVAPVGVAQARPVDPRTDIVTPSDIGPDKTDWNCTYQVSVNQVTCVYSPGAHRALKPTIRKSADHWWNPWSWGR
jgi:hypothetical protein